MYKTLGRMASEYPGIAKPEAQINDRYWGVRITAFKKKGDRIRQYVEVLHGKGEIEGRQVMEAAIKEISPDYIILVFYDGVNPPRKIQEVGDKNVMIMYLDEPWRRIK